MTQISEQTNNAELIICY